MFLQEKRPTKWFKSHKSAVHAQNEKETSPIYNLKEFFRSCGEKEKQYTSQQYNYSHVFSLSQFFESCTHAQVDKKDVTQALRVQQATPPHKSEGVVWASGGDYDEDYDVYEHLDKVPITMPPPLGPQDYMYNPYRCNVVFNAPQDSTNLQTVNSQNSLLEQENQQLKLELSQLQSEYSKLKSLHENLTEKYDEVFKGNMTDKIQILDQTTKVMQLQDQLVALQENYNRVVEHDSQICDKYNAIIPHLENANRKISELQQTVNKQDSLGCNKCNFYVFYLISL